MRGQLMQELLLLALVRKRLMRRRARCRLSIRRILKDAGIDLRRLDGPAVQGVRDRVRDEAPRDELQSQRQALLHHQLHAIEATEQRLRRVEARIAAHVCRLYEAGASLAPLTLRSLSAPRVVPIGGRLRSGSYRRAPSVDELGVSEKPNCA